MNQTNNTKNIAVVIGARPNFVKAAPFFLEAKKHPEFLFTLIHTGQHYEKAMSDVFFEEMGIQKPDIHFNIRANYHTEKIGKMFNELKHSLRKEKFDGVIIFGDVNSTLAGAIATAKNQGKLIHIESGLRSHDRRMPEEINRVVADHLSDLLFTTEPAANENLTNEWIPKEKVKYVGNLMTESMELFSNRIHQSDILKKLNLSNKGYVLVTFHRQENIDSKENLSTILLLLDQVSQSLPVVLPIHPGTKKMILNFRLEDRLKNLKVIDPLGYFDFAKLMAESGGVITDSGGIQEETSHLGIPCCTLRDNTERPITLEAGSNKLFPLEKANASEMIAHMNREDFKPKNIPLWDSQVSVRIFKHLKEEFFNA